jgi:ribose transport system permease protein
VNELSAGLKEQLRPRALVANGTIVSAFTLLVLMLVWNFTAEGGVNTFQWDNFVPLMTTLAFASFGTTLIVVMGGFDLSVAGVIGVANTFMASQMSSTNPWVTALVVVLIGVGIGAVNGFLVAFVGLESIVATLGTYIVLTGAALLLLAAPGGNVAISFATPLAVDTVLSEWIPVALVLLVGLALFWLVVRRTRFGVGLFAIGASEEAARMAGVKVRSVKMTAFALAGLMYALAGLYLSASTVTGDPNAGQPFLLETFAAVALGGASFAGGRGSAIGSILGAGVLTLIPKVLFAVGASDFWPGLVQGIVIIAAVLFGLQAARLGQRGRRRSRFALAWPRRSEARA